MSEELSFEVFLSQIRRFSNWGRWGKDDQLGTLNFVTPSTVAEASKEIKKGSTFTLSIPFNSDGPQTGRRGRFNPIHIMTRDGGDAIVESSKESREDSSMNIKSTDDIIIMPLQCATQWDSLAHVIHKNRIYNGYGAEEVSSSGAGKNSIALAADRIVGRAVLLDIPRFKRRRSLARGERITSQDLEDTANYEDLIVKQGDFVLVRTGRLSEAIESGNWADYVGGPAPGLALDSLNWIYAHNISGVASDTWGLETRPSEVTGVAIPFHVISVVYMGLLLGEIFNLEKLSEDCAIDHQYSFFFSACPLPISGSVGAPINPVAIK